jgi:hypothetical protein
MKFNRMLLFVPAAILAVACGRDDSNKRVDDALNSDLSLAAQARPYTALDSISAAERAAQAQGLAPVGYMNGQPVYSAPPRTTTTTPVPAHFYCQAVLVRRWNGLLGSGTSHGNRKAHQA